MDVIVCTKNAEKTLDSCLDALTKQTVPVKIIVVDGNSTDGTVAIAKKYSAQVYKEPNSPTKGSHRASALNLGLKKSNYGIVGFVDADTIVPPKWSYYMENYLWENKGVAGVSSGTKDNPAKKGFSYAVSKVMTIGSSHAKSFKETTKIQSIPGYNSVYWKRCIEEVGGFNEEIGGCEDWELNRRLRQKGYTLLGVPKCPVEHHQNYSPKSFAKEMYGYAWSRGRLAKKAHIVTLQHMLPSLALIALIILGVLFPPIFFSFQTSFLTVPPSWFEKVIEIYLFVMGLWSFVLVSTEFTFRLWLQTVGTFLIQHGTWAIGYLKGLMD